MNAFAVALGLVLAPLGALACAVAGSLLGQEAEARLKLLPLAILRLAARQVPMERRVEIHEEIWLPDVHYILADEEAGPLTRLVRATRYALSAWLRRSGTQMAAALAEAEPPGPERAADLRARRRGHRKEFDAVATRLHELLRQPAWTHQPQTAARILTATAAACEAYVDDRDEHRAESLALAALPLVESLGPTHPASFEVRRAHAHALVERGCPSRAESLLRVLAADEVRTLGPDVPGVIRTGRLLAWSLVCPGRFEEAEAEFRALDARLARLPGDWLGLRLHLLCMRSWSIACQGRTDEAEQGYDTVVTERSRALGADDPDTLDARHSKGKVLVLSGDGARAREVLGPLLADRRRVQGARHPDTWETGKYLAVARALAAPRRTGPVRRRALAELRGVERRQLRRHGPQHPGTRDTQFWIAVLDGSAAGR